MTQQQLMNDINYIRRQFELQNREKQLIIIIQQYTELANSKREMLIDYIFDKQTESEIIRSIVEYETIVEDAQEELDSLYL